MQLTKAAPSKGNVGFGLLVHLALTLMVLALATITLSSCAGGPKASVSVTKAPQTQSPPQNEPAKTSPPATVPPQVKTPPAAAQPQPVPKDGIIVFDQGGPLPAGVTLPKDTYLQPGEVLVTIFNADRFESNYGIGKILTPASEKTKGEAEVLQLYDVNKKVWVPGSWVITQSRPAVAEELKPGMLVLCGKLDQSGRRNYDTWFLGLVKNTDTLYKGEVQLERYPHHAQPVTYQWKVEAIRIIEKPQLRFKKVGSNYMKVP